MAHILIDMDGVVAHWTPAFNRRIAEKYPHIQFPFLTDNLQWDLTHGLDAEGVQAVYDIMNLEGFYRELEPVEGAVEAVHEMVEAGHTVHFCTTPMTSNPTCASDKMAWLEEHFGKGWSKKAILTSDKTLVMGDYLIDDKPEIVGFYRPTWDQILFDATYNRENKHLPRMIDWENWKEFIND